MPCLTSVLQGDTSDSHNSSFPPKHMCPGKQDFLYRSRLSGYDVITGGDRGLINDSLS